MSIWETEYFQKLMIEAKIKTISAVVAKLAYAKKGEA